MGGWQWDGDDLDPVALRMAENAVRQFDYAIELIEVESSFPYQLTMEHLVCLNCLAVEGLVDEPGIVRQADNEILGSRHVPPRWQRVPAELDDMLIYVNAPSTAVDTAARVEVAVHRAAFLLWRLNWIHPFEDGNGRTARTASYLVFCANVGFRLPGERAVPEILAHEYKFRHLDALEAADAAWQDGERIDVSDLERVLVDALVEQLKPGT